ncbi:hypothetical protein PHSC3_001688 [Chlamydiales bacterium STE3]|nr:hypothetical protein PHSC3_001688 [Chlamydiales bacterium STE3]
MNQQILGFRVASELSENSLKLIIFGQGRSSYKRMRVVSLAAHSFKFRPSDASYGRSKHCGANTNCSGPTQCKIFRDYL